MAIRRGPKPLVPGEVPLGPSGAAFFDEMLSEVEFSTENKRILRTAAMLVDNIEQCSRAIAELESLTCRGAGGSTVTHPLIVERRMAIAALQKTITSLRIPEDETGADGVLTRSAQAKRAALARWGKTG